MWKLTIISNRLLRIRNIMRQRMRNIIKNKHNTMKHGQSMHTLRNFNIRKKHYTHYVIREIRIRKKQNSLIKPIKRTHYCYIKIKWNKLQNIKQKNGQNISTHNKDIRKQRHNSISVKSILKKANANNRYGKM